MEDHVSFKKMLSGTLVAEFYLFSLIYSWSHRRYKAPTKTLLLKYVLFELVMRVDVKRYKITRHVRVPL